MAWKASWCEGSPVLKRTNSNTEFLRHRAEVESWSVERNLPPFEHATKVSKRSSVKRDLPALLTRQRAKMYLLLKLNAVALLHRLWSLSLRLPVKPTIFVKWQTCCLSDELHAIIEWGWWTQEQWWPMVIEVASSDTGFHAATYTVASGRSGICSSSELLPGVSLRKSDPSL